MELQAFKERMESLISKSELSIDVSIDPDEIVPCGYGIDYDGYLVIVDRQTPFKISDIKQIRYANGDGIDLRFFRFYFDNGIEFEHYYYDDNDTCFAIKYDGQFKYGLTIEQIGEIVGKN